MTKANKAGNKAKPAPVKKQNRAKDLSASYCAKDLPASYCAKDLPPSYYRSLDKKTKPQKDDDGYIIPT